MIQLARLVDAPAREPPQDRRGAGREPHAQAYAKLAKARFASEGTNVYPDATFTLRLAFGMVKGYTEDGRADSALDHAWAGPISTPRTTTTAPLRPAQAWLDRKDRLEPATRP